VEGLIAGRGGDDGIVFPPASGAVCVSSARSSGFGGGPTAGIPFVPEVPVAVPALRGAAYPEPHRPTHQPRPAAAATAALATIARLLFFPQDHEGRLALASQPCEADGHPRGQRSGPVQHHQPEGAAAQQDVRAPRGVGDGGGQG